MTCIDPVQPALS